jgi:hypothetical protein
MKKFMPHSRDEVPLKICSEKVKNHGSTSRVRSLSQENERLVATKEKPHLKHHTEISGNQTLMHKTITQKFLEIKPLLQRIAKGTAVLNNQLEGPRLRKESRSANERGTTASWKRSRGTMTCCRRGRQLQSSTHKKLQHKATLQQGF